LDKRLLNPSWNICVVKLNWLVKWKIALFITNIACPSSSFSNFIELNHFLILSCFKTLIYRVNIAMILDFLKYF
jgi:hypothetical protein